MLNIRKKFSLIGHFLHFFGLFQNRYTYLDTFIRKRHLNSLTGHIRFLRT